MEPPLQRKFNNFVGNFSSKAVESRKNNNDDLNSIRTGEVASKRTNTVLNYEVSERQAHKK